MVDNQNYNGNFKGLHSFIRTVELLEATVQKENKNILKLSILSLFRPISSLEHFSNNKLDQALFDLSSYARDVNFPL